MLFIFYSLQYNIYRQKPTKCFNYHAEETEIKLCGGAGRLATSLSVLQASRISFSGFEAWSSR